MFSQEIRFLEGSQSHGATVLGLIVGIKHGVPNVGGSAGVTVSMAVTFSETLPPNYSVFVDSGQAVAWYVSNKTKSGFTVNLVPLSSGASVAAGTFDVQVVA